MQLKSSKKSIFKALYKWEYDFYYEINLQKSSIIKSIFCC